MFNAATAIAVQRSALAKYGEFIACLTSADDELKRDVETTSEAQSKTLQPRTKPAILLMLKFQCPAPYFANALLAEVVMKPRKVFENNLMFGLYWVYQALNI